jgi:hydroxyacylglutathione hydrolase
MKISGFTGGIFETNCYLIEDSATSILFDAPEGALEWARQKLNKLDFLLLTHGHVDHVIDAAALKRHFSCEVGYHRDGIRLLTEPGFFRSLGFGLEIEPVIADALIDEGKQRFGSIELDISHVPGHCPGSLCFFLKDEHVLIGGDVLFAGGIGRWDLPGGDRELLLQGINEKLLPLGNDVKILPGHGPATTVGQERRSNPFLI